MKMNPENELNYLKEELAKAKRELERLRGKEDYRPNIDKRLIDLRASLIEYANDHSLNETLIKCLDEIEKITESNISFLHFVNPDQQSLNTGVWSTATRKNYCDVPNDEIHYPLNEAGVWADCVRVGKPVIHNDYPNLKDKKGLPDGHAELIRELVVPVMKRGKYVCIVGVGNKEEYYTETDKDNLVFLADVIWEIAEKKKVYERLLDNESMFRTLTAKSPYAVLLIQDDKLLYVNEAAEKISGYSIRELLSGKLFSHIHPEDKDVIISLKDTLQKGIPVDQEYELRVVGENNDFKWVSVSGATLKINDKPAALLLINDITERKITKDKLIASEEKFKKSFYLSPDSININRLVDGVYISINQGFTKITGYTEEDVIGKSSLDINIWVNPEDREKLVKGLQENGYVENLKAKFKTKDNRILTGLMSASVIELDGEQNILSVTRDITEIEEINNQLKSAELRFRTIYEEFPKALVILGRGRVADCNKAALKLFGIDSVEKAREINPLDISPEVQPDGMLSLEKISKHTSEAYESGYSRFEWLFYKLDGSGEFFAEVALSKISLDGEDYLLASVEDQTERLKAQEEITLLSKAVHQSPEIIFITDKTGRIEYVNPSFEEITGYRSNEVLGENPRRLKSGIHPREFYNEMWDTINSGRNWSGEFYNRKKNGEFYWGKTTISPIYNSFGEISHFVALQQDVTEKKRHDLTRDIISEISKLSFEDFDIKSYLGEIHKLLAEIINVENFYVALYNEKENKYTLPYHADKYENFETTELIDLSGSLTDYVRRQGKALIIDKEADEKLRNAGEVRMIGEPSPIWLGAPLFSSSRKKVIGVMAVQDYENEKAYNESDLFTFEMVANQIGIYIERAQIFNDLKIAKQKAEAADRLKSEFLAQISHEVRTPVNNMLNYASLLEDGCKTKIGEDYAFVFDVLKSAGERMTRTIDLIIDTSQLISGSYDIHPEKINLCEVVELVAGYYKQQAERKNLGFTVNFHKNELSVYVDDYSVKRIIENLVDNAIKFTNSGEVVIDVYEDADRVVCSVKDTGIGMSEKYLERIFEPFSQEEQGYSRRYDGNGLGLTLVKKFCDMNNAEIKVESEKNKGSKFTVFFPKFK